MKLPALSLRQPWAWLVLHGKSVENRTWGTGFRGPFLIHAAKGMTRKEYLDALDFASTAAPGLVVPDPEYLPRSGIVGLAELVNVLPPEEYPAEHWRFCNQHGFVLERITELPFLGCAGWHRFWSTKTLRSREPHWPGWEIADARESHSRAATG